MNPEAKGKDAKGKNVKEKVEQELPDWEQVEKKRWILETEQELELFVQFQTETLSVFNQAYESQMCNKFESVKFDI